MIKIRFNKSRNEELQYHIKLNGKTITIEVKRPDDGSIYADRIPTLKAYNTYALAYAPGRAVYRFRDIEYGTNAIFYDLNVIAQPMRYNFNNALDMFNRNGVIACVDTGILAQDWRPEENRDIVISILQGSPETTTFDIDAPYEIEEYDVSKAAREGFPRDHIWDGYAVKVNGINYVADGRERNIYNNIGLESCKNVVLEYEDDKPLEFEIQKFHEIYTASKFLNRDIDNDEVLIDSTAGITNAKRIYLEKGKGSFKLFPLGYEGKMHLKLGRRWYVVQNDYVFTLKKKVKTE